MSLLKTILYATAGAATIGGLAWLAFGSDYLRFTTLRVVGNDRAPEAHIRHLADLTPNDPLLLLDLNAAVAGVARHPWVASVEARRVFPDTVVIEVHEREVRALVLLDALYLVDADGSPFRKADPVDLDHPIITGIPANIVEHDPALARRIILDALAVLDASKTRSGLDEQAVSEVQFDAESGYTLALRNGGSLLLGFQEKQALARLDTLVARGVDLSHPLRIDLGSPTTAVVTPL